jgi:hypothetical protein
MRTHHSTQPEASADAVALLKADHRQVRQWFDAFGKSRSAASKRKLVAGICNALTVHTRIEEEIFHPAFLAATRDVDRYHEAEVEHAGARNLIAQIQAADPADDYFDSRVHALFSMFRRHVKEEEQPAGIFAEARGSKRMDLKALGARMAARKTELMAELRAMQGYRLQPV